MGTKDKLLARLQGKPKDFTFDELETLLYGFGCKSKQNGSSAVKFAYGNISYTIHKPHGRDGVLHHYQVKETIEFLRKAGLI